MATITTSASARSIPTCATCARSWRRAVPMSSRRSMASAIAAAKAVRRHLARIRYRLLLVNVLVAAVPLIGISFARMHEEQLLAGLEQDMIHQAQLVRALILSEDPSLPLVAREPA